MGSMTFLAIASAAACPATRSGGSARSFPGGARDGDAFAIAPATEAGHACAM